MPTLPQLNPSFTLNPQPQVGGGAFGRVPGAIGAPPSTYTQVGNVLPGLPNLTKTAGSVVGDELSGKLSQGTVNFLQDKAAQFGVTMGLPGMGGGGFASNQFLRNLGLTSEQLSQQGLQSYNQLLPTLASTQLQPGLEFEIAQQNALNAAAPDPRAATQEQLKLMQELYQQENPASGTITSREVPVGPSGVPLQGYYPGAKPSWEQNLYV